MTTGDTPRRALMRLYFKRGYEKAKANGRCIRGCGRPADPGKASCSECSQRRKELAALRGQEEMSR